jgi:hypothetical protein
MCLKIVGCAEQGMYILQWFAGRALGAVMMKMQRVGIVIDEGGETF